MPKISELTPVSSLIGPELLPVVQSGVTKSATAQEIAALAGIGTAVENFGASPTATATVNTAAIQAALDQGGSLYLVTPGVYQINAAVQIGSDTYLYLGPGVTIKGVADNINLLETKAYHVTPTSVSLAWVSGHSVTVTWTNHGLSVGDAVCVQGANQSQFNGVFLVQTVPTPNTFTYTTVRLPATAPTGTILARQCNQNIFVSGGTWDRNYPAHDGTPLTRACMFIGYLQNAVFDFTSLINFVTFGFEGGALRDVTVSEINGASGTGEICKVYGPAFNVNLDGIYGFCGDDGCSFHTREFDAFSTYRWTQGDIIGCSARNIFAVCAIVGGHVAACYISTNEFMDQVHYENIYGTALGTGSFPFVLTGDDAANVAGLVTVKNVKAAGNNYQAVQAILCTVNRLEIINVEAEPPAAVTATVNDVAIVIGSTATIKELVVDGFYIPAAVSWTSNPYYGIRSVGVVDEIIARNWTVASSSRFGAYYGLVTGTLSKLSFYDCNINGSNTSRAVTLESGTLGTPKISFYGGKITGTPDIVVNAQANCSVLLSGLIVNAVGSAVVTLDTAITVDVTVIATKLLSGTNWYALFSGSPTLHFLRIDDITGSIYYSNGTVETQFAFSNGGFSISPSTGVGFAGGVGQSYIQFDQAGVVGPYDWNTANGGTFAYKSNTPAQITGNQNNYNPGGYSKFQRWSSDASRDVTGLTFTVAQRDGQEVFVTNVGTQNIVLKEQTTSTAANQFMNSTGADITLAAKQSAYMIYDGTTLRWRVFKMN